MAVTRSGLYRPLAHQADGAAVSLGLEGTSATDAGRLVIMDSRTAKVGVCLW